MPTHREFTLLDKPITKKIVRWSFFASLVILVILDLVTEKHPEFDMEKIPAFYSIFGFVACVGIVLISKVFGLWLKKKEDYYD